jgi:hypothetical protein
VSPGFVLFTSGESKGRIRSGRRITEALEP